jgi:hypothetical protein
MMNMCMKYVFESVINSVFESVINSVMCAYSRTYN